MPRCPVCFRRPFRVPPRWPGCARSLLAFVAALALAGCSLLPEVKDETAGWIGRAALPDRARRDDRGQLYAGDQALRDRSRRASRTAATRSRRCSRARTRTTAPGETAPASRRADRFIRTYPNHPNVDYAYYLKGLVHFREDQGLLGYVYELDLVRARPKAMRESFAAFKELVAQVPGQPVLPRTRVDAHALPVNALAHLRGQRRALLLQPRRVRRGGEPRAGGAGRTIRGRRPTRTRSTSWCSSYDKLGHAAARRGQRGRILQGDLSARAAYLAGVPPKPWWKFW